MTEEPLEQPKPEEPRDRLYRLHKEMCAKALALMRKKNADYATALDPLSNFRRHGPFGIVVRMDDKLCRVEQLIKKAGPEVEEESEEDTLIDLINYPILLRFMRMENKNVR